MSRTNSNNHFRTLSPSQTYINEVGLIELPPTSFLSRGFKHIKLNISSSWIDMDEVIYRLFPSLYNFDQKSIFNKISSIISAPVIFLLTITLPVVKETDENNSNDNNNNNNNQGVLNDDTLGILEDLPDEDHHDNLQMDPFSENDKNNGSWCRWLTAIQLIGSPFLFALVLSMNDVLSPIILLPVTILIGASISILFLLTTSQDYQPRLYWMMCFMGFGMAVIWIYIIANEVVSVLQTIGMALGVSEAILGLTIFAMVI